MYLICWETKYSHDNWLHFLLWVCFNWSVFSVLGPYHSFQSEVLGLRGWCSLFQSISSNDQTLSYSYLFTVFSLLARLKGGGNLCDSLLNWRSFLPVALNQGRQFAEAVGFKQEPKQMSFYGLLAISELWKCNGQFIGKKHLSLSGRYELIFICS